MGCGCSKKIKKISEDTSTAIVYRMVDIVKSVPLYNMEQFGVSEVSNSEWSALLFVLYQISMFVQFDINKKRKEFIDLGGCVLCYDSIIAGLVKDKILQKSNDGNILFLVEVSK